MSMPHDDSCITRLVGRHRRRQPPSSATFIGRVGGLAVALGIGAAIASSAGTAMAETDGSDSSSAAGSGATNDSPSTKGPSSTSPPSVADAETKGTEIKDAETKGTETKGTETTDTETKGAEAKDDPTTSAESKSDTSHPSTSVTAQTNRGTSSDKGASNAPGAAAEAPPAQADPTAPAVLAPVDPAPTVATKAPIDPVPSPQSPASLAMLALARRENGNVSESPAATANAIAPTSLVQPTASIAAVSPLGTAQQLAAEQIAAQTVDSLPVQLAKLVLRFGFLNAAQQQFNLVGGPDQENLAQLNRAVDEYAMGAAFQQQLLNSMDPTVVMQVAPPHGWYGQDVDGSRILYDNPDTIYRFMGVNRTSTYVITGRFANLTDGVRENTNFSLLTGLQGTTAQNISGRDLVVNPDGTFTITVSAAPGVPGENHIQLTSDSTLIATRNTLSDWANQEPMSLSIQRVSGPPNSLFSQFGGFALPVIGPLVANTPLLTTLVSLIPPLADPPPLLRGVVTAGIMLLGIQREAQYMAVATTDPETGARIRPNVLKNPTRNAEFLATQLQSAGYFQLADDQALVLTIDPGDATYFVVPVTNDWTITDDYWDQQTSLNNVQAKAIDGVYTIVISPTDPGVANWVSTGGLNQGTISIRFQDLPLDPTHLPTVQSQVVLLSQLPNVLPANTIYVTPAELAAQLVARKAGFDNRFAPYPQ